MYLGLFVSAIALCCIIWLVARHNAEYSIGNLMLIVFVITFANILLPLWIPKWSFLLGFLISFILVKQFCNLGILQAVVVIGLYSLINLALPLLPLFSSKTDSDEKVLPFSSLLPHRTLSSASPEPKSTIKKVGQPEEETFYCFNEVPAYALNQSSVQIGSFKPDTLLKSEGKRSHGMVAVRFEDLDHKQIRALCHTKDFLIQGTEPPRVEFKDDTIILKRASILYVFEIIGSFETEWTIARSSRFFTNIRPLDMDVGLVSPNAQGNSQNTKDLPQIVEDRDLIAYNSSTAEGMNKILQINSEQIKVLKIGVQGLKLKLDHMVNSDGSIVPPPKSFEADEKPLYLIFSMQLAS